MRSKAANDEKDDPKRGVTAVTAPPKEANLKHSPREAPTRTGGRRDRERDRRSRKTRKRAPRRRRESDWRRRKQVGENKETRPRRKRQRRCKGIQKRQRGGRKMGSWVVETGKINLRDHIYYSPSPHQVNHQKVVQE